jgi:CPA2 family monovalent cation:H+ antiporter-2
MEEALIVRDLTIALLAALIGGVIATHLKLPAISGYLLAGIMVGPYTPGVTSDVERIQALAEIGVVLLMFGVGVQFSLDQLRGVRRIAVGGGVAQVLGTIALGVVIGMVLGWPWGWRWFFGCILAISSTAVMLKLFMDRGELDSKHGQIAIGISLVQDLSTVLMMALLPVITTTSAEASPLLEIGWAFLRIGVFLGLMLLLGVRLFPWVLARVAQQGSRELFLLTTVALSVGTALLATAGFGLSLALGAFVAGLVVSESEVHYRILSETLPIRDIFATVFFVSVGMLIDPAFLWANIGVVLLVTGAIVGGKFLLTVAALWSFSYSRRTLLLAAAGLAQIGEFSFVLAQQGVGLGVLDTYLYGLTLSGALLSTLVIPLLVWGAERLAEWLDQRFPVRDVQPATGQTETPEHLRDHVVICGYGRVGTHLVEALQALGHPYVVIEQDWLRAQRARARGAVVIYGDATTPAVLAGAHLDTACVVVVTIPDPAVQRLVVQQVAQLYPQVPIIARAKRVEDLAVLYQDGASEVIMPTFEGGLEMMHQALIRLGVPPEAIQQYTSTVRSERYESWQQPMTDGDLMRRLRSAMHGLHLHWYELPSESSYVGQSIGSLQVRRRTGASIVAIVRDGETLLNPDAATILQAGDRLAVLADAKQSQRFVAWLEASRSSQRSGVEVNLAETPLSD